MFGLVANSTASSMRGHARTAIGRPFQAETPPATPTQRSRKIDWSIIPMTGRPRCASAIRVPNSGRPVMNDLVPSMGSSTQTNSASIRSRPCSSPRMPWSG